MTYEVIILAAGQGKRMGAGKNKIFLDLDGIPIIIHTLRVFEKDNQCKKMWIVINTRDKEELERLIQKHHFQKNIQFVIGGAERQHSVYNAVQLIQEDELVLVHDAARPFVQSDHIYQLVLAAKHKGAAVLAVQVKDTIKKVIDNKVAETIDRSSLWAVQTPQAFRMSLLAEAHQKAFADQFLGTDDASLVERLDKEIEIVTGSYDNIKLTTCEDLFFAEAIVNKRKNKRELN